MLSPSSSRRNASQPMPFLKLRLALATPAGRATPIIEDLKIKARELGLWNMFLPKGHYTESPGWTNLEYGLMAEWLGRSRSASEACNCAAPDTGNMEVLAKYGNAAQKAEWLKPLMEGKIRSAFLMTEPDVASSDATNIELDIKRQGNEYVLNGSKWWSSGAGDPRCEIYIVMGKTDAANKDVYRQQSVVLVPATTPGIKIQRMLKVYGYDDAPTDTATSHSPTSEFPSATWFWARAVALRLSRDVWDLVASTTLCVALALPSVLWTGC
uniref:Acyl-CoA oxidase/dehydrogenase middle domain-containing protein n=1 Tax=Bionectria ochroleuca TaxID=29856 RepID=A0A8H7K5J1_BIOOC